MYCLIMTENISLVFFIIVILLIYFAVYYVSELIIKNELQKKKTKRISNSKIYKTITRHGEDFDSEFPFNPNLDEFWTRLFAKLLDYAIYVSIFYLIEFLLNDISRYPLVLAFLALFLINPIFESLTGRTFGKLCHGLRVIDDFGEIPSFLTAFIKNLLQLSSIIFYVFSSASLLEEEIFFHNKRTFTYTIWNSLASY